MAHFLWLVFLAVVFTGLGAAIAYQLTSIWQERRWQRIRRAERSKHTPIIRTGRRP